MGRTEAWIETCKNPQDRAIVFDPLMDIHSITPYTFYDEFEEVLYQQDIRMFVTYNGLLSV